MWPETRKGRSLRSRESRVSCRERCYWDVMCSGGPFSGRHQGKAIQQVHELPRSGMTRDHTLGGLPSRPGGWESEAQVWAGPAPPEASVLGILSLRPHVAVFLCLSSSPLPMRTPVRLDQHHPWDLIAPESPVQRPSFHMQPHSGRLGVTTSTWEVGGGHNSALDTRFFKKE